MSKSPLIRWLGLGLTLCTVPLVACDDASAPADPVVDQGATADGGQDGPCRTAVDCFGGQICVELVCTDCLADGECAEGPWGGVGACLDGRCCQAGTEGCACGTGCGDGLACESDRCVPAEPPCEVGTPGCDCSAARPCPEGQACNAGACEACAPGALGCACDAGACAGELICEAERCVEPPEPMCDAAACAAEGRVCADEGIECGACDTDAEFIDDGQGGCMSVAGGDACDDDSTCAEGTRCLALLPGRGTTCVTPPACIDDTNAWSAEAGACAACPSCDVTGSTGQLWPTTSRGGECVCETTDGFYYDVARAVQAPRPCDADGDGWVQRPAHQYLHSADPALQRNAHCAPTTVATVRLINERGEVRDLAPADLDADGALVLYEPDTLDAQSRLDAADDIVPWGDSRPSPAWLNPLTKLCVSATADFNGNGLSDLEERPSAELNERTAWMAPFLKLSHFAELHTTTIDPADGGTLIITERPRCDAGFPLDTLAPERGAHWRECERRRSADYTTRDAGFDLAAWSCDGDADSGSCPGLTPAERTAEGAIAGACSGPATDRFTGMNHHSQFACLRMSEAGGLGRVGLLSDVGTRFATSRCLPDAAGTAACAAEPEPADGAVLWATVLETKRRSQDYVNGCVPECGVLLATCDAYDADPELNSAGCSSDSTDFGKLICNRCPTSNTPCQLSADNAQGLLGVCRAGTIACIDGEPVCEPDQLAPSAEVVDHFGDDRDDNCDGFDGDLSRSLFVRIGPSHADDDGSPEHPFTQLSAALDRASSVEVNGAINTIYLAHDTQGRIERNSITELQTLVIPSTVNAIIGGMLPAADCPDDAWCAGAGLGNSILVRAAVGMYVGPRSQKLLLQRFDLTAEATGEQLYSGRNGVTHLALRINNPIDEGTQGESCADDPASTRDAIVLDTVTLTAASGVDGHAGPDAGDAISGTPGGVGAGACRIAAGTCGHHCPDDYWLQGQGGACACGSGAACAGGAGGLGGVIDQPNCMPDPGNLEDAAQNGVDGQGGGAMAASGGMASNLPCPGEENPLGRTGADGGDGDGGAPGVAGAAFYSASGGWIGRPGADGRAGTNGAGAGGGAGGAGSGFGIGRCPQRGGHGAGGGSGGCGGLGGQGGGSGGGSIGLMVVAGDICLINSPITASDGGNAGEGATGQTGGAGGLGGRWHDDPSGDSDRGHPPSEWQTTSGFGARGGDGGDGGDGGNGGHGVRGITHAVLLGDAAANVFLAGLEVDAAYTCGSDGLDVGQAERGPARTGEDCVMIAALVPACQIDADCPDHQRCVAPDEGEAARCVDRGAAGDACEQHPDCASAYCALGACADPAADGEACPEGIDEACGDGACLDEICVQPCLGNPDCAAQNYCQIDDLAAFGVCTPMTAHGERCESNAECRSGACGTSDGICFVPCDNDTNCDDSQWCADHVCTAKAAHMQDCRAGVQCVSGACGGGSCLECDDDGDCANGYCDVLNHCNPVRDLGGDCGRDGMCESGLCEVLGEGCVPCRVAADCNVALDQICYVPVIGNNECITPRANGQACEINGMCASNTCRQGECRPSCDDDNDCGNEDYCLNGGCTEKLANGEICGVAADRVCASGICDGECAPCVRGRGCGANQYCEVVIAGANSCQPTLRNGRQCSAGADWQCTEGACVDRRCRTSCDQGCTNAQYCKAGGCVAKLDNGVVCGVHGVNDDVCASGVCDGSCVPCLEDAHCPGELCHVIAFAQNECVLDLANGSACGRDIECETGYCNLGVCEDKAANGALCPGGDRVCESGRCNVTCQACHNDDAHCGADFYCHKPVFGLNSCQPVVANGGACGRDRVCDSRNCNFWGTCIR
jgi:hypothetical protein